jgi:glycine cleavage system transcriptional repressor
MNKAILSVLGKDQPGIVAAVTGVLFAKNCNVENVSQTILQTEFAGIFIVSLSDDLSMETLKQALVAKLQPLDLNVHIKPLRDQTPTSTSTESEPFIITTKGPDRKGLVAGITEVIARYGVNITNLQAVFKGGDEPGDNIMIYEVDVPVDLDQKMLDHELRERAKELLLEISIQHRNIFEAINRI